MFSVIRWTILILAGGVALSAQNSANEVCAGCHEQPQKIANTVHGKLACSQCHAKHEEYPHPANIVKPACASCHTQAGQDYAQSIHGQQAAKGNAMAPECTTCHQGPHEILNPQSADFRKSVPDTCGMCHDGVAGEYKNSVHGLAIAKGEMNAAVCTDCHGEHKILAKTNAASTVNGSHLRETCGQCHGNVALARRFGMPSDRLTTFDASFHGLAAKSGNQTVANCASCHGIHNILPSNNVKSMTNARNLPGTCGKCHPGAGERFALGPVHQAEGGSGESPAMPWIRAFYLTAIPFTIGLMALHHGGDLVRKLFRHFNGAPIRHSPADKGELRMLPYERFSHLLLAVSFIVLAYTGLALKFPDQWWARPLLAMESSMQMRRNIHRIAAVLMMLCAMMHVAGLIFNRKLREHWMELMPKLSDATDGMKMMAYNLGFLKTKPQLPHHTYVGKVEYWAMVWGTLVMVGTGGLLWANNWSLKFLPKWVLDLATAVHWYEAVLATLAIVVWHFYSVIFDPEIYPMDFSWLTGHSSRPPESSETLDPAPGRSATKH